MSIIDKEKNMTSYFHHGWTFPIDNPNIRKMPTQKRLGWECPKCGNCYSPIVLICHECKKANKTNSSSTF